MASERRTRTSEQRLRSQVEELTRRAELAEEVIRLVEDDALPPAALAAWERYRARYPRD